MVRGRLFERSYVPRFSGHETFPLRYGWLKKAFDRVAQTERTLDNKELCWGDDAIARWGVGKNMVSSMRHWAKATRIIEETDTRSVNTTRFGRGLFALDGLDPYMEHPATLWLIHWQLAAHEERTTWFWTFNYYPAITFDRENLEKKLGRLASDCGWKRVASTTIKSDVACFIRTYVARQASKRAGHDDSLESPLTELGLIKPIDNKNSFRLLRGPKSTLGDGVFVYALLDFWSRYAESRTLSIEAIAHAPGAPGRVFLFDENDVADRLARLEEVTNGALRWSEAAGLKQIVRNIEIDPETALSWVWKDFEPTNFKAA